MDVFHSSSLAVLHSAAERIIRRVPEAEARVEKALAILLRGKVSPIGDDRYEVVGSEGQVYVVDQRAESCPCSDFTHRAPVFNNTRICKHRVACWLWVELGRRTGKRGNQRSARLATFRRPVRRLTTRKVA